MILQRLLGSVRYFAHIRVALIAQELQVRSISLYNGLRSHGVRVLRRERNSRRVLVFSRVLSAVSAANRIPTATLPSHVHKRGQRRERM